ncbi:MAG TPA: hypothetical protein VNT60_11345 [Deinococcales bacterium]|nr:hypothetical protein [Deinococcales bacterium]
MSPAEYREHMIDITEAIESVSPGSREHLRLLELVHEVSTKFIWAQANVPEDVGREVTPTLTVPGAGPLAGEDGEELDDDFVLPPGAIIIAVPLPEPAEA